MYFEISGHILLSVISDSDFLMVLRSVIGLRFLTGPLGLPGLGGVIIFPVLMSILSWVSNIQLKQVVMVLLNESDPYFRSSPGISSGPVALLLLSLFRLFLTSSICIGFLSGLAKPSNASCSWASGSKIFY